VSRNIQILTFFDCLADFHCPIARALKKSGPNIPRHAKFALSYNISHLDLAPAGILMQTEVQQQSAMVIRHVWRISYTVRFPCSQNN
jgi:hypothetical protein